MNKPKKAFTLVELIIVITILTILATIAFISFQGYTKNARDGNRLATLNAINKGLEMYSIRVGKVPAVDNQTGTGVINGVTLNYVGDVGDNVSRNIGFTQTPKDPFTGNNYIYGVSIDSKKYQTATVLETVQANTNVFLDNTYAQGGYEARVLGNYNGLLIFNSGSTKYIANMPSLIFNSGGTLDIITQEPYFVVNKGRNLPYFIGHNTTINNQDKGQILSIIGSTATSLTGVTISDFESEGSSISEALGYEVDIIGSTYYGSVAYYSKYQNNPSSGSSNTPSTSCPTNPTDEEYFEFEAGTITDYDDELGPKDVVIPCTIGGVEVTSIGDWAFANNQLTSVTIPNGVMNMGFRAFYNNLFTSVTIPNGVTNIGYQAFAENQLTSVTIPSSVTTILYGAFEYNSLTNVIIEQGLTNIGDSVFANNQITNLTLSNSVTNIGEYAFAYNQLTSVTIPNSVTSIGEWAFDNNQLTSVTIPNSVTSIGDWAFTYNRLTSVTIPNSVTSIGDEAFMYNGASNDSDNITWTSGNGGTWAISGTNWVKQ